MIVQCEHCQTKYRIADEKVKGKGVKVRCAKCENVFTIAPPENELLDQSAAPALPPAPGPPAPEQPAAPPLEESAPGYVTESPPEPSTLPSVGSLPDLSGPHSERQSTELSPPDEPGTGFMPASSEGESPDIGAHRPAHERDQTGLTSPTPSSTEEPEDGGFELEATTWEESTVGSDPLGGQADEGLPPLPQGPEQGGEWGDIAIDGQAAPDSADGGFGLAEGADFTTPPPAPPMEQPEEVSQPDHESYSTAATSTVPSYQPEIRSSGGGKKWIALLLLFGALGGGGYFAYPRVMEMIQARGQQTEGTLTPANIEVKALNRTDGKIIYAVRGKVLNESGGNVGMIQVEAQFRNAAGDVVSKATAFCGNLFDDSKLVSLKLDQIQTDLHNELGQSLSNANILPGKSVPFLIILDSPPAGISKVTVTISGFKETT